LSADYELHEKAAKALGWRLVGYSDGTAVVVVGERTFGWRPSKDDGDALRMATALGIAILPYPIHTLPKHSVIAKRYQDPLSGAANPERCVIYEGDAAAATRRAILECAAAIATAPSREAS
jgi:hypothetical protein